MDLGTFCWARISGKFQTFWQVKIGTDVAASEFYTAEKKHYDLDFKNPSSPADASKHLPGQFTFCTISPANWFFNAWHTAVLLKEMKKTATQLADYYKSWLDKYPFVSIEDCHVPIFRTVPPSLKLVEWCKTVSWLGSIWSRWLGCLQAFHDRGGFIWMNSNADGRENAIKRTIMRGKRRQTLNIEQLGKINENELQKIHLIHSRSM